jgi:hypothetical protein
LEQSGLEILEEEEQEEQEEEGGGGGGELWIGAYWRRVGTHLKSNALRYHVKKVLDTVSGTWFRVILRDGSACDDSAHIIHHLQSVFQCLPADVVEINVNA